MADPPDVIGQLVNRFDRNLAAYKSPQYNETELRVEFVNPFWSALGWDMENKAGHAMAYRDVIHEDAVKVGTATKAPDYCFRIGGARKFFLETKRPARDLKADPAPAYQLRRYGWSAKLPLSVLTDFEELIVYDCRVRPRKTDKASQARILCIHFKDYLAKWEELNSIFSHEAVLKGSFDRYVESAGGKRGTAEVDTEFLKEIEGWRDALARNIALRNLKLTDRELNFAVQMTIDRIIFLRMCEDRGIERYGRLQALCGGPRIYPRLVEIYREADERYNSGLFHFEQEKDRTSPPDELTPRLTIDDKVLKDLLSGLYYPDSPYEFRILPPEILGNVYEQFLGKVIRLTAGHQAKVEEKPEVRKAGGVYYTPSYIVDYIVKNTVGRLLDLSTPSPLAQVSALRILDPACGSGSFLLGAYQYLLDWHLKAYLTEKEKTGKIPTVLPEAGQRRRKSDLPVMYQGQGGDYLLTTVEKKRILLNNIYGVDIDPQAVEVTKLSLLLKVLENENQDSLRSQLTLWRERALPDLSGNIKCGNSLIGPDFYQNQQLPLLAEEDKYRINAFDWNDDKQGFGEILRSGGFDAVIGNPPYVFTRNQGINENQKNYFYGHYKSQSVQLNTFGIFVERCHQLLRKGGGLGFITPSNWLTIDTFAPLRQFLFEQTSRLKLVNILNRVFQAADVDTSIVEFAKDKPSVLTVAEMENGTLSFVREVALAEIKPPSFIIQIARFKDRKSQSLFSKVEQRCKPLSDYCTVSTGLKAYQTGKGKPPQTDKQKQNRVFHAQTKVSASYGKYLNGVDVCRYRLGWSDEYLSYGNWLAEPRRSVPFDGERLLIRQIPSQPPYLIHAVVVTEQYYHDINSMVVFAPVSGISLKYLLGCINSRLLSFWFLQAFDKLQRKIFPQFKVKELAIFPIRQIDFSNAADKSRHDRIVALVDSMLDLHKKLPTAKMPDEKTRLEREISATDRQIDALVYELYGLTEEDIRIVERSP